MTPAAQALPLARLLSHAADAVAAVRDGRSLTDVLARVPPAARAGTQALAFHALRWLGAAQSARSVMVSRTPPPKVDALLTVAIALLWPDGEPPYAAHTLVDQAVTLARQRVPASANFVNAVLRRFLRERDAVIAAALNDPVAAYHHPAWWIERVRHDWPACWEALLQSANAHPPMTLRVNARRIDAPAYVRKLASHGLEARALDAQAVVLARPCPVSQLPGFAAGEVSVQDAAAQRAAPLLLGESADGSPPAGDRRRADHADAPRWALAAGARVLDACAAPGGKTAHLLERADVDLLALDSDSARLGRVQETLDRLGLHARLQAADARRTEAWWDGRPFDAILLDAPCSASGIVRRHPDIRWLRRASDIATLTQIQSELLESLWPLLAPGGRLLYATCSIFRAEGQERIDAFLQRHPDARAAAEPVAPGHLLPLADNRPHVPATSAASAAAAWQDGFFYALLEKP